MARLVVRFIDGRTAAQLVPVCVPHGFAALRSCGSESPSARAVIPSRRQLVSADQQTDCTELDWTAPRHKTASLCRSGKRRNIREKLMFVVVGKSRKFERTGSTKAALAQGCHSRGIHGHRTCSEIERHNPRPTSQQLKTSGPWLSR